MKDIINSNLVKNIIMNIFNKNEIEVLERPKSLIIKLKDELKDKVTRIILLHPKGFTSNTINETSPHPEARKAKITIKGGVKPGRDGFNILKDVVIFSYYTQRDIDVTGEYPSALVDKDNPLYREEIKSAKDTFLVVKENGEGFYHNLLNLSNEWVLLILEKELKLQKKMEIASKTGNKIILKVIEKVKDIGDNIFNKEDELVSDILKLNVNETILPLIEALNIPETGKHEPCTVYAIILKFGRRYPKIVLKFLENALEQKEAPKYYLDELIKKITKK